MKIVDVERFVVDVAPGERSVPIGTSLGAHTLTFRSSGSTQVLLTHELDELTARSSLVVIQGDDQALELLEVAWKEEAARELTWLARRGLRSRAVLLELSARLSEADAHHEALRLAKIYFRDYLEGGRRPATSGLWSVAYPMGYVPVIRSHAAGSVDPYLVAALIREESLYDAKALSPAGAIGLMQLMPATARQIGRAHV